MAMDVDEDEDGTQRPKQVLDYGIQVDFESIDEDNLEDPGEAAARFDKEITEKTAEIERMAPNMKAMERSVVFFIRSIGRTCYIILFFVGLTTLR
jgi:structural maintenance of chromosome 1